MRLGQTSLVFLLSKVFSSLVGFLATIYLARTLGPGVLGIYFLVLAAVIWFQLLSTMGISKALIKKISEGGDVREYVSAALLLELGIFIILIIIIFTFENIFEDFIGYDGIFLVVIMLFSNLAFAFISAVLKGSSRVHVFAFTDLVKQFLRAIIQVAFVVVGFGLVALLGGHIIGTVFAAIIGIFTGSVSLRAPTRKHFFELLSYAKFAWLTDFETRSFSWMDTIVLGFFVSTTLIGIYEITWNVASFLALFSTAISQTLFPEISRAASQDDYETVSTYHQQSIAYSGLFLIPGLIGALFVGEELLSIYGESFTDGTHLLIIFILARLLYGYQSQFVNTLNSIDRPELAFQVNGSFILLNLVLNVVLVYLYGWTGAAVGTTIAAFVGLWLGYLRLSSEIPVRWPLGIIAKEWIAAGVMGALILSVIFIANELLAIGMSIPFALILVALGGICYFTTFLAISAEFRQLVTDNLSGAVPRLG